MDMLLPQIAIPSPTSPSHSLPSPPSQQQPILDDMEEEDQP